ncbi:hypothetical protein ABT160_37060 [Streptomyces sp. NPDC001941]|uniref:hypothetical protein n=1 Tax=Streptomyces sp. NPDC001941 TaxID=3154659 RepID=UPI003326F741
MALRGTTRAATLLSLPAALCLVAAIPAAAHTGGHDSAPGNGSTTYQVDLEPLNDSKATGTAMLTLNDRALNVKIEATGLVPGQPHAQHIHGSTDGHDFRCPDASADKNGDGIVTTAEGLPMYGDINISLTTKGDTSKGSGLDVARMPVADQDGKVSYERTIEVSQQVADHIKDLHVVQHGIDPNGNGKYDFSKGKSELDPKLPQEATAPASCGMLAGAAVGSMPVGGVETGSGPAEQGGTSVLVASGSAALLGAGALSIVVWRRRSGSSAPVR